MARNGRSHQEVPHTTLERFRTIRVGLDGTPNPQPGALKGLKSAFEDGLEPLAGLIGGNYLRREFRGPVQRVVIQ